MLVAVNDALILLYATADHALQVFEYVKIGRKILKIYK